MQKIRSVHESEHLGHKSLWKPMGITYVGNVGTFVMAGKTGQTTDNGQGGLRKQ